MKKVLIVIGVLAAVGGTAVFIRSHVPPHFSIEQVDWKNKTGYFLFGGKKFSFGLSVPNIGLTARNGYSVQYRVTSALGAPIGIMVFDLYKKGKFVKQLGSVDFAKQTATGMY